MSTSTDAGFDNGRPQTSRADQGTLSPSSPTELAEMVRRGASRDEIAGFLTALRPSARLEQVVAIRGSLVGKLYEAVGGGEPLGEEDLVAKDERGTVILEGRNSLPAFSRFQKRFARIGSVIVGYNHGSTSFVTGPGYFIVRPPTPGEAKPDELFFDYTTDPPGIPTGWPAFKPSDEGVGRLVWMNMKDFCRRVGPGVLVGKAYKRGVEMGAYFTLTKPY